MITFEDARQVVAADWPDYDPAPWGFEGDEDWFVLLLPETTGGRIAAVDKESGELNWINENADEYTQERPAGAPHDRNAEEEPTPQAVTWLRPDGRVYRRDDRGRFGSGGGGGADEGAGMRPELAGATSLRALETAAVAEAKRITGRDITFSAAGSDLATAKSHFEGVMQALERFPKANLNRVVNAQIARNAYAHATSDGSVVFNTKFSSAAGRQKYLESLAEDSDGWNKGLRIYGINDLKMSSYHVRNAGTPEGVALHEMGHIIDIATTSSRSRPLREHVLTLATAREQRKQTIPGAPIKDRGDMVLRSISGYAMKDHHELAAEAFADVMINGKTASKLSHAIFNALNAEYEIQTGGQP